MRKVTLTICTVFAFVLIGCVAFKNVTHKNDKFVVMELGYATSEGSYRSCVNEYLLQGKSVKEALSLCNLSDPKWNFNDHRDPWGSMGSFGSGSTGVGAVDCKSLSIDPRRGFGHPPSYYSDPNDHRTHYSEYRELLKDYSEKYDALVEAEDKEWEAKKEAEADPGNPEKAKAAKEATAAAKKAINDANEAEKKVKDWQLPSFKTDPAAENVCNTVAQFIAECNQVGWRSQKCQLFLKKMDKCGDPMVTDPTPEGEVSCNNPVVDPKKVEKVVLLVCNKYIKPAPGQDPCMQMEVEGTLHRYFIRKPSQGVDATPCGDPLAMTSESQCTPTFTLAVFGKKDLQTVINEGRRKLGGPIFVLPVVGPPQPGPR